MTVASNRIHANWIFPTCGPDAPGKTWAGSDTAAASSFGSPRKSRERRPPEINVFAMIFLSATCANKGRASVLNNGLNDDFCCFVRLGWKAFSSVIVSLQASTTGLVFQSFKISRNTYHDVISPHGAEAIRP